MASNIKDKFFNRIHELTALKRKNCTSIFESQYKDAVQRLNELQKGAKKCSTDYSLIARYQLIEMSLDGGPSQILVKKDTDLQIVALEQLFDIIEDAHLSTGHGGRDTMINEINKKYANVTKEQVMVFLELCKVCQLKKCQAKKSLIVKPIMSDWPNSRCQVDLIDMQSQPDGKFRFILEYQDHLTKVTRLRALETNTTKETAHHLVEIFCELGAPLILQSDNGREFAKQLVKEVLGYWPECRLVHGKPRHSPSQSSEERANRDVQTKLAHWQKENNTSKWSDGLKFVQWQTNTQLHSGIGKSPYKAMFRCEPHLGITAIQLPKAVIAAVETEEELSNALGSAIEEGSEQNSSPDPSHTCIICDQASSGAHHCKECGLTCHAISPCSIPDSDTNESEESGSLVICRNCAYQAIKCVRQNAKKRKCIKAAGKLENSSQHFKTVEISLPTWKNMPAREGNDKDHQSPMEICETQLEIQEDSPVTHQQTHDARSRTDDVIKSETFDYAQLQKQVEELRDRLYTMEEEHASMHLIQETMIFANTENAELRQQIAHLEAKNKNIKKTSV